MNFDTYEFQAAKTDRGHDLPYYALGLNGEAGEVAEKVKKILRGDAPLDETMVRMLELELGDVLWYLAACCRFIGTTLNSVAVRNLRKLESRASRNVIKGSGDNR